MTKSFGYAAQNETSGLAPFSFERRDIGPGDILIDIEFCGICHSDIHQVRGEWGNSKYPMVPGHEIVGKVTAVGANVTKFAVGDTAGVGCMVDSCGQCEMCKADLEQFCSVHCSLTYNSTEQDKTTLTQGGYSTNVVVKEEFALKVDPSQDLAAVAPLLCAGITTYSPLMRYKIGKGSKVGVVGLGGLGHMGVKFAVSMGAEVTVFSTSPSKEEDAKKLGAHHFVVSKDPDAMKAVSKTLDMVLDTVSADHDLNMYLATLKYDGSMVLVGLPDKPAAVAAGALMSQQRNLTASAIGGIKETQEMLDYCAANNITSDIELVSIDKVAEAYERTVKADVRYRFVIDSASLKTEEAASV